MPPSLDPRVHRRRTARLLAESAAGFALLFAALLVVWRWDGPSLARWGALAALTAAQGAWIHRLYTCAHEAVHRKLVPRRRWTNDAIGQLLLLPLLVPMPVYRAIHNFHHTHNRRDPETSALGGYLAPREPGRARRALWSAFWYAGVFAGGYFWHGVASIAAFLLVPPPLARRLSPAFKRWTWRHQLSSALLFLAGVGVHAACVWALGWGAWFAALGAPMLVFAWIYSLLVYVYHYRTTFGPEVVYNVRSVRAPALFRWWLLNFNHHRVHHRYPGLPWYALPDELAPLPADHASNEVVDSLGGAIWQQWRGPEIFIEGARPAARP